MKLAVIPARGGSKRIPRKNIRPFLGKPIIAYSIEAAVKSGCFDKVIVSTDDPEIAEVAGRYGAELPFMRPAELSDDYAVTLDVIQHAIEWYQHQGEAVEQVCCIYATAPFVTAEALVRGHQQLVTEQAQYAFPVTSFAFPIQRALKLGEHQKVTMCQPEHLNTRSQDLEECFHDAGQFYWGQASAFLNRLPIFASHSSAIQLPRNQVQDIDTEEDWLMAEAMYRALQESRA